MESEAPAPAGEAPLDGLRVLELAGILAGPQVGQFCAELGADVIKIEPPGGDATRHWRVPGEAAPGEVSAYFACANYGKRSRVADLRDPADRAAVQGLARDADVVITAFRPGADRRLGLDPEALQALQPRLIVVRLDAYGPEDPRPGFDAIIQAEAGFTGINGTPEGPATKMPVALMDLLAAHQLKQGLLLALLERERTGRGTVVQTSLLTSAVASLANQATNVLRAGTIPRRMGSDHPNIVPYGSHLATADGSERVLAVGTERQFRGLLEALECAELAEDPRFADNAARVRHREPVLRALREAALRIDGEVLDRRLLEAGVPFGRINRVDEALTHPAARDQQFRDGGAMRTVALTGDFTGRADLAPPPALDPAAKPAWRPR